MNYNTIIVKRLVRRHSGPSPLNSSRKNPSTNPATIRIIIKPKKLARLPAKHQYCSSSPCMGPACFIHAQSPDLVQLPLSSRPSWHNTSRCYKRVQWLHMTGDPSCLVMAGDPSCLIMAGDPSCLVMQLCGRRATCPHTVSSPSLVLTGI